MLGRPHLLPDGLRRQRPPDRALRGASPRASTSAGRPAPTSARFAWRRPRVAPTGLRGAVAQAWACPWTGACATPPSTHTAARTAQQSPSWTCTEAGAHLPVGGPGAVGHGLRDLARPGGPRDPRAASPAPRASRFDGTEGGRSSSRTTRPELLPACVALYCHPERPALRARSDRGARPPCRCSGTRTHAGAADPEVELDFGTGLMMVCTFGDGDDVRRWKRDGLETRACASAPTATWRRLAGAGRASPLTRRPARRSSEAPQGPGRAPRRRPP